MMVSKFHTKQNCIVKENCGQRRNDGKEKPPSEWEYCQVKSASNKKKRK